MPQHRRKSRLKSQLKTFEHEDHSNGGAAPPNHHALFLILFISGDAFGFGSKLPNTSRPQKYLGGFFVHT